MRHSPESPLLNRLRGGKRNSVDGALAVAQAVLADPGLFPELITGLSDRDSLVRMRSAYAVSKAAAKNPGLLRPFKEEFLDRLADPDNSHLAKACMLGAVPYLPLSEDEADMLKDMLLDCMHSESSIVKTLSLQLLADFAEADPALRPTVLPLIWKALDTGTPAMRARARKLMKKYSL